MLWALVIRGIISTEKEETFRAASRWAKIRPSPLDAPVIRAVRRLAEGPFDWGWFMIGSRRPWDSIV